MTTTEMGFGPQTSAEVIPIADSADYSNKWSAFPHSYLIRAARNYKVFLDADGNLDWVTSHEFDRDRAAASIEKKKLASHILGRVAIAQSAPSEHLDSEIQQRFNCLLGEAITCTFECEFKTADKLVDAAMIFHRERKEELSRSWYLRAAIRAASITISLGAIVWLMRDQLAIFIGAAGLELIEYAAAGTLGALLSVIARSGKLRFDPSSGRALHVLEASSRICAGGITAILAVLAVKSGLILGTLVSANNTNHALLFAAVAAGAAERFGSSIISRFESAVGTNGSNKHNKGKEIE